MSSAITSATGYLGRLVIEKLKANVPAASIIALARDPAHASDLGVTVREADHGKAETLSSALEGPLLPPAQLFDRVKRAGAKVLASATTVTEARWLADRGVDAVIAMGSESGGHRARFLTGRGRSGAGDGSGCVRLRPDADGGGGGQCAGRARARTGADQDRALRSDGRGMR